MRFQAFDNQGTVLSERVYYSMGGGFVIGEDGIGQSIPDAAQLPYPFSNAESLLAHCEREGLAISDIMLANEGALGSEPEPRAELLHIWETMKECVSRGCSRTEEHLPGNLMVRRRAPRLLADLPVAPRPARQATGCSLWAAQPVLVGSERFRPSKMNTWG
ncbi:serine dehydratase beta chain [Paenarthrobacter nitroguajacolicus]